MILVGGVDTAKIHSLNGLGVLSQQSGHYVNPLAWRQGIQGLGLALTPGLRGCDSSMGADVPSDTGNAVLDCACKCSPAQSDSAIAAGLSGLGATTEPVDLSLEGTGIANWIGSTAPSLITSLPTLATIPNWLFYGLGVYLVMQGRK